MQCQSTVILKKTGVSFFYMKISVLVFKNGHPADGVQLMMVVIVRFEISSYSVKLNGSVVYSTSSNIMKQIGNVE